MGIPLVLDVGEGEFLIASDASPIVEHTRNVIYLDETHRNIKRKNILHFY
tara:strand:- start:186 stop:335 length:150 start_codon:yes stop_codon:yes gene_type:complete